MLNSIHGDIGNQVYAFNFELWKMGGGEIKKKNSAPFSGLVLLWISYELTICKLWLNTSIYHYGFALIKTD